jgi:hypothetical protein
VRDQCPGAPGRDVLTNKDVFALDTTVPYPNTDLNFILVVAGPINHANDSTEL